MTLAMPSQQSMQGTETKGLPLLFAVAVVLTAPLSASAVGPMHRFNVLCPAPRLCRVLERDRRKCEAERQCDGFLSTLAQLLPTYDCQAGPGSPAVAPAIRLCERTTLFADSLETLAKLKSRKALRVLASAPLRNALDGYLAELYWEQSAFAERRLVLGDTQGGDGPPLEGGAEPIAGARASSTSPRAAGEGFDPELAADRRTFTAWCTGKCPGVGEWLEMTFASSQWRLSGFEIIPGYTRTQASYSTHRRPTRVRIASCSDPSAAFEADLELLAPDDFNRAGTQVDVPGDALKAERSCVRFTILEVSEHGSNTCISEIVPLY